MTLDEARAQAVSEFEAAISVRAAEIKHGYVTSLRSEIEADQNALQAKRDSLALEEAELQRESAQAQG